MNESIKEAIELAAGNYAELDLAEQWDYCWNADLAQADGEWAEKALEVLPSDCLYRQDLAHILLSQEADAHILLSQEAEGEVV